MTTTTVTVQVEETQTPSESGIDPELVELVGLFEQDTQDAVDALQAEALTVVIAKIDEALACLRELPNSARFVKIPARTISGGYVDTALKHLKTSCERKASSLKA